MSGYPNTAGHRHVDTSVAAATHIAPKVGRLQRMVLDAVVAAGSHGVTTDEMAALLNIDRGSIQPRTSELRALGLIHDSGNRRTNKSGIRAIVWIAGGAA